MTWQALFENPVPTDVSSLPTRMTGSTYGTEYTLRVTWEPRHNMLVATFYHEKGYASEKEIKNWLNKTFREHGVRGLKVLTPLSTLPSGARFVSFMARQAPIKKSDFTDEERRQLETRVLQIVNEAYESWRERIRQAERGGYRPPHIPQITASYLREDIADNYLWDPLRSRPRKRQLGLVSAALQKLARQGRIEGLKDGRVVTTWVPK